VTAVLGIDTGGTFTDFVLVERTTGQVRTAKVPSTPANPADAVRTGLEKLGGLDGVDHVIVGTTVATNAVIQRQGPDVVVVMNRGFEDVPFIGRMDKELLYDLHWQKPRPLALRRNCIGVAGRFDHHGEELEPLGEDGLDELRGELSALDLPDGTAVAVCLLFSYLSDAHEERAGEAIRAALPGAFVSLSHEVSPVWREYERVSTTIADAFVKPMVTGYVERVGEVIRQAGGASRWNMLASNGGYLLAHEALQRPAQLLLSGLAGGVIGARHFAGVAGYPSAFSLDMGGTSSDIGLVLDGDQRYASEFQLAWGVPVTIPCVSVTTIGAGGGSIAWVDRGGLLHVGPQSAGAQPGPVAYGMGGTEPTVTDANLALGRLDAAYFLGGEVEIDGAAAGAALTRLGDELELSTEEAALAVVETTDENMANAIRLIAVEQGLDPRELALIAFGGAGPLHARAVAERLGITTVLVPPHPGLCSAFGAAITEARVDRVQTTFLRSETIDVPRLAAVHRRLVDVTVAELRRSVEVNEPALVCTVAMRYSGQNYELEVPVPEASIDEAAWLALVDRFAAQHEQQYGFSLTDEPVELVNLRVTALRPEPATASAAHAAAAEGAPRSRPVWFDAGSPVECSILRRDSLAAGAVVHGPAIIEEPDSTTVVFPDDRAEVEPHGTLVITVGGGR
jgi:N-methylhydantoinase A